MKYGLREIAVRWGGGVPRGTAGSAACSRSLAALAAPVDAWHAQHAARVGRHVPAGTLARLSLLGRARHYALVLAAGENRRRAV